MEPNEKVYEAVLTAIREGQPACTLTVVEVSGSTPREVGAKMLLRGDGSTVGTIGGGELEAAATADAREALRMGASRLAHYSVRAQDQNSLGVCGGEASVFIEVLRPKPTLLVVGGGQVGQPLAQLGTMLGFRTVVVDDRAEVLTRERFPSADELVVTPFHALLERVAIDAQTHVVILTHGHQHDETVLRQVLDSPAAYIGMIGSHEKVRTVFDHLLAESVTRERLAQVHAPVGLRTRGQTPEEIALSIMAEIVLVRYGGTGEPLSWRGNPARSASARGRDGGGSSS